MLTDFRFQQRLSHAEIAEKALPGGADVVQFRQKDGTTRSKLYEAARTAEVCRRLGATLIIDDHVDLALAVDADGVHLGQEDIPVGIARRLLGEGAIVGATASTTSEARAAEDAGADYVGFGPVFPTASKANPRPVRGLAGLEAACSAVSIPVIAIAGLTPERVKAVLGAGAHGVAVMTAITTATDVERATAAFRRAIDQELTRA